MKNLKDTTVCIVDCGYFISVAEMLSRSCKKVYYHTPIDREFQEIETAVFGEGVPGIERLDDPLHPAVFETIDWWVFPDLAFASMQGHLRSLGKPVWGNFDASEYELYRTEFLDLIKELDLPYAPYETVVGLTNLTNHLKTVKDKWVKVDRYRKNMETWHHIDFKHSQRQLEKLAVVFGGAKESVVFVVQDNIKTDIELGYDGWTVDGQYPNESFQGYEKKNELYMGAVRKYTELPQPTRFVNDKLRSIFKELGYRDWMATEIRVKDSKPYFTDPTFRMPGMTGEQMTETCSNLPEVMYFGAHGITKQPVFKYRYALSASMHYTAGLDEEWGTIHVPPEIRQWVKCAHYMVTDDMYQFPPGEKLDLGVILGVGNTLLEAFAHLKKNIDALKDEPISFELDGFFDLLKDIREAESKGMKFSDGPIPTDDQILRFIK